MLSSIVVLICGQLMPEKKELFTFIILFFLIYVESKEEKFNRYNGYGSAVPWLYSTMAL